MAGIRCTICDHPEKATVNSLLVKNTESLRIIAARYGLSFGAVRRHRENHLPKLVEQIEAAEAAAAEQLVEEIRQAKQAEVHDALVVRDARSDFERFFQKVTERFDVATSESDAQKWAQLLTKQHELRLKLGGHLQQGETSVNVNTGASEPGLREFFREWCRDLTVPERKALAQRLEEFEARHQRNAAG